jgi:radical SAM superfamily enzyme YgiQ (UPF0313 family)
VKAVLLSTYELGRQPFGLASPAAWLRRAGVEVTCADVSRDPLPEADLRAADLVAFYVPMHTATRLAARLAPKVKALNPAAHLCFYGLYAPPNEAWLRSIGGQTILGGEFEPGLLEVVEGLRSGSRPRAPRMINLDRLPFLTPDRVGLPDLQRYAHLHRNGEHVVTGYTEASRGCKHLCRHCPVVPVYQGVFRIVPREVVLADIRQQVAAGARHMTFGDPDFLNGPGHALAVVEALHREFPQITYDVTAKIEHLLRHAPLLPRLRDTGCVLVTSAVESLDDHVLRALDKGHTREDFLRVAGLFREIGLTLNPTFVAFHPWTTLDTYRDMLRTLAELDLVEHVSPVQLAIRLLIPEGSRLLELEEMRRLVAAYDAETLCYPWRHPDPQVDQLADQVQQIVAEGLRKEWRRRKVFARVWEAAGTGALPERQEGARGRAEIAYLNEPWYC